MTVLSIRSRSNGPGLRAVVWLQGCSILCPGCINQEFLPFTKQKVVSPTDMVNQIRRHAPDIEGITVSGGEPFDQVTGLAGLVTEAQRVGLSTLIYTGYDLATLPKRFEAAIVDSVLQHTDILIDGAYQAQQRGNFLGRGSANQTIYFLSTRYDPAILADPSSWLHEEAILEAIPNEAGHLTRTGILQTRLKIDR